MLFRPKDKVVFTSYEDKAWGEDYAGKTASIISIFTDEDNYQEATILFEDRQILTVDIDELLLVEKGDFH